MNKKGFTLIELLIVIAIIAIIAAVIFVALDPLKRFQDSRDSTRWQEVTTILEAIQVDQVDNGGGYITSVLNANVGSVYMISDGANAVGCDDYNTYCDTDVSGDSYCVNLSGLVTEGYMGDVPVSPDGDGTWSENYTGYTLQKSSTGTITIRACESEGATEIEVLR
jgi:prepilin-type N-terminal cleavage/methylation domain-containing protein